MLKLNNKFYCEKCVGHIQIVANFRLSIIFTIKTKNVLDFITYISVKETKKKVVHRYNKTKIKKIDE